LNFPAAVFRAAADLYNTLLTSVAALTAGAVVGGSIVLGTVSTPLQSTAPDFALLCTVSYAFKKVCDTWVSPPAEQVAE
jgi:hypothetical protein